MMDAPTAPIQPNAASVMRPQAAPRTDAQLHKAAEDFAAVAINEMLAPMFQTTDPASGPLGGGEAEETWRPMLVSEIAKQIARGGALGIADPVYRQMLSMQERGR